MDAALDQTAFLALCDVYHHIWDGYEEEVEQKQDEALLDELEVERSAGAEVEKL